MSVLWMRPARSEAALLPDERRVRTYVAGHRGISESVDSLSAKLGVSRGRCRQVLEDLARQGIVRRMELDGMAPLYCRYPGR